MIYGIGTDITTVSRIKKSLAKHGFLEKNFSEAEREKYFAHGSHARNLAANFAAKEALGKALGIGIFTFPLSDAAVLRDAAGEPFFALTGKAAALIAEKHLTVHVSLTHEGDLASAVVVLESEA